MHLLCSLFAYLFFLLTFQSIISRLGCFINISWFSYLGEFTFIIMLFLLLFPLYLPFVFIFVVVATPFVVVVTPHLDTQPPHLISWWLHRLTACLVYFLFWCVTPFIFCN